MSERTSATDEQKFQYQELERLLKINPAVRAEAWERDFLKVLPHLTFRLIQDQPKPGPDGWPYLFVRTDQLVRADQSGEELQELEENIGQSSEQGHSSAHESESIDRLVYWLSERGIGMAINPHKDMPDYVLTYGMIWNFRERGHFISELGPVKDQNLFEVTHGEQLYVGEPSSSFLPLYVKKILKQFWLDQGVVSPKINLVSRDKKNFDLCFSQESLGSPPQSEWRGILEAMSWFLPPHYTLGIISEKVVPQFQAL